MNDEELRHDLHKARCRIADLELRLDITKSMLSEALRRISDLEGELEEYIEEG
jgi:chromosome segregation ATPase